MRSFRRLAQQTHWKQRLWQSWPWRDTIKGRRRSRTRWVTVFQNRHMFSLPRTFESTFHVIDCKFVSFHHIIHHGTIHSAIWKVLCFLVGLQKSITGREMLESILTITGCAFAHSPPQTFRTGSKSFTCTLISRTLGHHDESVPVTIQHIIQRTQQTQRATSVRK